MPANKTVWVLGDKTLNEAAGHYQKFKPKPGEIVDDTTLYLERQYDLKRIPPGIYSYDKDKPFNAPALIMDNFVDTLNLPNNPKVPDTVVILWNDYHFWNDEIILQNNMVKVLHKFIKEIRKVAEIRNFALPEKAANWDNPRIFVTRPLPLPNGLGRYPANFKANRRKFLKLLHKGSKRDGYTTINFDEFSCENKNKYFNTNGTISDDGYNYIWMAISNKIQEIDKEQDKLRRRIKAKQLASCDNKVKEDLPKQQQQDIEGVWDPKVHKDTKKQSPARRVLDFDSMQPHHSMTEKDSSKKQSQQSDTSSHTKRWNTHHKFKRGRGRGNTFFGLPPPPGFIPFNPFFHGFQFKPCNSHRRGRPGPY